MRHFIVHQVINECAIYDMANVKGIVYNLKNETTVSKEGQLLRCWKGMMKDDQDKISLVLFDELIDDAEYKKYYEFKKLRVQRFINKRLLRSTEKSTALAIKNSGTQVTENEAVESEESRIQAKVCETDMKTLVQTFLYPEWISLLEIENVTNWCNNCENLASKSLCQEKASVKVVVINADVISYSINVVDVLIVTVWNTVTVSNNSTRKIKSSSKKHSPFLLTKTWLVNDILYEFKGVKLYEV